MEAFFTVVIIIVIIIIIFAMQSQLLDDSLWIAENHALTKLSSLKVVVNIFFWKEDSENFLELLRNDRSSHR